MLFLREKDVRKWLKQQFDKKLFWVEQAPGGTNGFPDAIAIINLGETFLLPLELKCSPVDEKGMWLPTLRPSQKNFGITAVKYDVLAGVLVGQIGSGNVWISSMDECVLAIAKKRLCKMEPVRDAEGVESAARSWRDDKMRILKKTKT
jgi:hypothetical protein